MEFFDCQRFMCIIFSRCPILSVLPEGKPKALDLVLVFLFEIKDFSLN